MFRRLHVVLISVGEADVIGLANQTAYTIRKMRNIDGEETIDVLQAQMQAPKTLKTMKAMTETDRIHDWGNPSVLTGCEALGVIDATKVKHAARPQCIDAFDCRADTKSCRNTFANKKEVTD